MISVLMYLIDYNETESGHSSEVISVGMTKRANLRWFRMKANTFFAGATIAYDQLTDKLTCHMIFTSPE